MIDRPQPHAILSVVPLDEELVIYNPVTGASFVLNETGRLVWERCNGERTRQEIAREIAALHDITLDHALDDVTELLMSFQEVNLIAEQRAD